MDTYQHILQSVEDKERGTFIFNEEGDLQQYNNAAESMLAHLDPSERKTIFGHLEKQCKTQLILGEIAEKSRLDLFLPNPQGEYVCHKLSLLAIRYMDTAAYVAIFSDLPFSTGDGLRFSNEEVLHYDPVEEVESLKEKRILTETLPLYIGRAKKNNHRFALFLLHVIPTRSLECAASQEVSQQFESSIHKRLSQCLGENSEIHRLNSDSYLLLKDMHSSEQDINQILNSLSKSFLYPIQCGNKSLFYESNIGAAEFPKNGMDSSSLLEAIDIALNTSKCLGANRGLAFKYSLKETHERHSLIEQRLISAIEDGAFELSFQPTVALTTKKHVGYEVTFHWKDAILGRVSADEFMPIAEQAGLLLSIGDWMLNRVFTVISDGPAYGLAPGHIAIPIFSILFRGDHLLTILRDFHSTGKNDNYPLVLELSERLLLEDNEMVSTVLTEIKTMGIELSLRNFGNGTSPLGCIRNYPLDYLKIAPSCVQAIESNHQDSALCTIITQMAHAFNLQVVAEGVDTPSQYTFLKKLNCDYGQGSLFSKPIAEKDLINYQLQEKSGSWNRVKSVVQSLKDKTNQSKGIN